jgi:hypothetical protein
VLASVSSGAAGFGSGSIGRVGSCSVTNPKSSVRSLAPFVVSETDAAEFVDESTPRSTPAPAVVGSRSTRAVFDASASIVTVRGNVFDGCQRRASGGAVIIVDPMVKKLDLQRRPYHRKLVVEDNVFRNVRDGWLLSAYSLGELVWRRNLDGKAVVENPKYMYWNAVQRVK